MHYINLLFTYLLTTVKGCGFGTSHRVTELYT